MISESEILQGKILIVDDNQINIQVVSSLLKKSGYTKLTDTTNPLEVSVLHSHIKFDVILLDYHMPMMNGLEVIEQLKIINPDEYLPVLVLTADTTLEIKKKALACGAKDFLSKPFDSDEVRSRVKNIMQVSLLQKMLREQNNILEIKVQERTKQLEDAHIQLIKCLGRAAEYRDNETGMHVVRIGKMTQILGKMLGLTETECHVLGLASPMHDIGKIGIADNILLKPGKLENDEWKFMQQHSSIGGDILRSVGGELLITAALIAETHHEKWDGSGYPKGLIGDQIPLITRITSVCDVFDALLSERPYKKPWTLDKAVAYLVDNSNSHFDPNVVEQFICILPQIMEIREKYSDNMGAASTAHIEAAFVSPQQSSTH